MKRKYLYYVGDNKIIKRIAGYFTMIIMLMFGIALGLFITSFLNFSVFVERIMLICIAFLFVFIYSAITFDSPDGFWAVDEKPNEIFLEEITLAFMNINKYQCIYDAFQYLKDKNIRIIDDDHLLDFLNDSTEPITKRVEPMCIDTFLLLK